MHEPCTAEQLLGLGDAPAVVAVVGCCGKTTLIAQLAHAFAAKKVLISPTTKIKPMHAAAVTLCTSLASSQAHTPRQGLQCLGLQPLGSHKLEALPSALLAQLVADYDLVLLEADGSRGLPCKGWLKNEPVIPAYCTHTVGIVTLRALDQPLGEETVLRLPEFQSLTGLLRGDRIGLEALCRMVCAPEGMFRNSVGKRFVLINQIESPPQEHLARKLIMQMQQAAPGYFAGFAYGSALQNQWIGVSA